MERTLSIPVPRSVAGARREIELGAVCGWLLGAVLIIYLGVRLGGYEVVTFSQVGIVAWWILLLLVAWGLVRVRISRAGWTGFALLCAYAAWTTLSLTWTESSEATIVDVSQMLLYVALLALVLLVAGRTAIRSMLSGTAAGIVVIAVIALLSRLHYQWFSVPAVNLLGGGAVKRLSYPIEYWNALAALMAIGFPLLLYSATGARTLIARSAAAGAIPLLAACAFLTASRGGIIEIAAGLVVFVALAPERLSKLATIAIAGAGSALLVEAANQRAAVREGLRTTLAAHQGSELLAIAIVVVIAVGLLAAAAALVERHVQLPRLLAISRRQMTRLSLAGALVAIVAFAGAGGFGFLERKWEQFKSPGDLASSSENAFSRLQSTAGEGRYQYWQVAVHAANGKPLTGTGANTFQFLWLAHGNPAGGYVVDAHSLYMQALGDLGYPGLLIIVAFVLWIIGYGVWRVIESRDSAQRLALAAATAGALAFAFSAAIDWIWFIPVLPFAFFVCAGVIFASEQPSSERPGRRMPRVARIAARAVVVAISLAAIIVIALPMAATQELSASHSQAAAGHLSVALADAHESISLEPYAAAGYLQEALVEEQAGNLQTALAEARQAVHREPINWQNWIVLSRLELRTGHASSALADEQHAHWLNPNNFPS